MQKRGVFVIDDARGFKFGTFALAVACEQDKCALSDLLRRIGLPYETGEKDGQGNPIKMRDPVNLMSLLHFFYGAAVSYAESKNMKPDFKTSDVSEWLDELGIDRVNEIMTDGLNQYTPKNSTSPAEKGEEVLQSMTAST